MEFDRDLRARQEVRLLAQQAQQAFEGLQKLDQSGLDRITEALSRAGALHAAELAREPEQAALRMKARLQAAMRLQP